MIRPSIAGVAFGEARDGNPRLDEVARAAIATQLGIPVEWAWVRQVHGTTVAEPTIAGIGMEADAAITSDRNLPVAVSVADCFPVAILADNSVGIAHAGWRGAAGGVVAATIGRLRERGHEPHTVVIGPGIGACCFEVGPEVTDRFPDRQSQTSWATPSIDLVAAIRDQAPGMEIIELAPCTHHDDRFNSYRRDGTSARQFAVAWIAPG